LKTKLREFLAAVYSRNPVLAVTGWGMLAAFAGMLLIARFDDRVIMGIDPWIKPMKFAVSIFIFVWTVAWFSGYVARFRKTLLVITWGVAVAMSVEIVCIVMQAVRGTTSHFNNATSFDGAVFSLMGNMIALNTVMVFLLFILFCARIDLPPAYLWGIRMGLLMMLAGSAEGGFIVANDAHAIGVPDGGPGLPIVNWSTQAGDLRVAHFMGLHALQIIPFAGFLIGRHARMPARNQVAAIVVFAAVYLLMFALLLWQATSGKPVLGILG